MEKKRKIKHRLNHFLAEVVKVPKDLKQAKTIKVLLKRRIYDSKYKRYYMKTSKYLVHYEGDPIPLGTKVKVYPCRRISTRKALITY